MDRESKREARDGIADTLATINDGTLAATDGQRAYLAGAVAALDAESEQDEAEPS